MAKNVYFTIGTKSEQRLYEDLIIESMKIYGLDVYYLPREMVTTDRLFREDTLSKFDENYLIEMYLTNYDGFEGDGTLLTKFGVRISEEATFVVSRRRWEDLIQAKSNNLVSAERPNEGDAIYFPLTKQLFQIKFVENETPLRPLGDVPTFTLVTELMEFADERLETGLAEIDKIAAETAYSIVHKITSGIKYIYVTSAGSGYGAGTTVSFNTLAGAVPPTNIVPTITNGSVASIAISNPGSGYTTTAPTVTITGTGTNATAEAILSAGGNFKFGELVYGTKFTADVIGSNPNASYNLTNVFTIRKTGSGYTTAPLVTIGKPDAQTATATATTINGIVTALTITSAGTTYPDTITNIPTTTNGSGTGLRVNATASNGVIQTVTITSSSTAGTGYAVGDTINIVPTGFQGTQAVCTITGASNKVGSFQMTAGGTGYTSAPTVTVSAPDIAGGTQATGSASVSGGAVTSIGVLDAGDGYTSPPTVTIAEPTKVQALAQATVTNGTISAVTLTTAGNGYVSKPRIIIAPSPSEPKGKVARWDVTNKELELIDIVGTFSDDDTLIGIESQSETVIDTFSSIENENASNSENAWFETEGDNLLDWTEGNPFGEVGNSGVF